ncbi:MAG: YpsA SLOG family protein [Corynebacterium sp.]|uniref:YpsA SLOG family protein n=1 Tax=Corynebacterium sp. TaxID=1720 RepID=UPI003F9DBC8A
MPKQHNLPLVTAIRSGGQSGADRGALDAARNAGIPIIGWCPAGGWAEDYPVAPGLHADYPELTDTPSADAGQRTEWNVRDSHVTLIIDTNDTDGRIGPDGVLNEVDSPGTGATILHAMTYGRECQLVRKNSVDETCRWLESQGHGLTLNIAGPRASESPSAYDIAYGIVTEILGFSRTGL